jgi:hypothetical protein
MSLTSLARPRSRPAAATALLAGAAVWLALGLGNAGAASTQAGSPRTSRPVSTAVEVGTVARATAAAQMAPTVGSADVSSNWAGYAVAGPNPTSRAALSYRAVSGTWVQPTATCTPGRATYSAFWVGLGGFAEGTQALEQIGTDADCTSTGTPKYSVWYELVPGPAVPIKLKLAPGNTMSAVVVVDGSSVTLRIRNVTRGTVFTKKLTMTAPDVSSAEWVAEAPSSCNSAGRCQILPLTNFGTVLFSQAAATTLDGGIGTISNPAWSATPIELVTDPVAGSGAAPGVLASDGSGFSVSWQG